jgi:hypothetical protein
MGLDIKDLEFQIFEDDKDHHYENADKVKFKDFTELEEYYLNSYKKQKVTFEKVKDQLVELEKNHSKNPQWLENFKNLNKILSEEANKNFLAAKRFIEQNKNIKKELIELLSQELRSVISSQRNIENVILNLLVID